MCGCLFESRFSSCIVNIKDIQLGQLFACDLHHESYQRLNQTLDTCMPLEHGSFLAACYKLTTPATSRAREYRWQHAAGAGNILTSVG